MRGFLLTSTWRVVEGVPEVRLHGILENGEACLIVDDRARPCFHVHAADAARARAHQPTLRLEPSVLRSLDGDPLWRVQTTIPSQIPALRQELETAGIACLEADLPFPARYRLDRGLRGSFEVTGPHTKRDRVPRVYRNPGLQPAAWTPKLRVLSIDIETGSKGELYAIGLHTPDFERVLVAGEVAPPHAEAIHSERALLRRFVEYVAAIDPDVITGWNVIDFDLSFLHRMARRHGMRLELGRGHEDIEIRPGAAWARDSRAVLPGRVVLDGLALFRAAPGKLPNYRLETVAQHFLGHGKLLTGKNRQAEIDDLFRHDLPRLVEYNLQDARLVTELLASTHLIELAVERSLLTGVPLDRTGSLLAAVDSLYLGELRQRGFVASSLALDLAPSPSRTGGGEILEPRPGLHRNVGVGSFRHLSAAIVRTFRLDPLTWAQGRSPAAPILMAPNGEPFRRDIEGVLPELLQRLSIREDRAHREARPLEAKAIGLLIDAIPGALGSPATHLFSPAIAAAVSAFGHLALEFAAQAARDRGAAVLYGDTDTLFLELQEIDPGRALERFVPFCAEIERALSEHLRDTFSLKSELTFGFDRLYLRLFLPETRGGKGGSRRRYAALVDREGEEEIRFVGLESVRRDSCEASRRWQREILQRVFHDEPVAELIREFVADLRAGRRDEELVIHKTMRRPAETYTHGIPPHVRAATQVGETAGHVVSYVMTRNGPEAVGRETAVLDYEYYLEHHLAPVADAILRPLGTCVADILTPRRQLGLFD